MLHRYRHCWLALLMILQSVSPAWAQVQVHVIGAPPSATQVMQTEQHCEMMAKPATDASKSQDIVPIKEKSACHCCDQPCSPAQCAAMHLQAALPDLNIVVAFALTELTAARYAQIAVPLYSAPPTPPPNAL